MARRPLLLDLFCCEGGAAMGYHRAGFDVIGVDINPQSNYPFTFVQADALNPPFRLSAFDAIHASPPCQAYTFATIQHRHNDYPELVEPTRAVVAATGLPYVIENVPSAGLAESPTLDGRDGVVLCGSMFGMQRVRRHRVFESNVPLSAPGRCRHEEQADVLAITGHSEQGRTMKAQGTEYDASLWGLDARREAMGMPWASRDGVSEAIPPAYTEHIGQQLLTALGVSA